ncbi:Glutathione S-transferase 2 [Saxophila tyrrhenica]|uniref:Glutathione S-transferase 2 n=1 Tax=Saxophila tyrrhenica TaxID=1690608 RepID=A0AAV9P5D4_9PEZI|nr:Glutathione S-transferase 2 [Saxophila tyrrhenica]
MPGPNITLYTGQSPNGVKISITLEELGLPYTVREVNMKVNEQKSDWFAEINPNGRIPAITDTFDDGETIRVFESGSIMQYLVARYDTEHKISYPVGTREHVEVKPTTSSGTSNWSVEGFSERHPRFQASASPRDHSIFIPTVETPTDSSTHYFSYAKDDHEYAATRYQNEVKRLYGVLDKHLRDVGSDYIVGSKMTIADIAHWGWITLSRWAKVELSDFPTLKAWEERVLARPAVEKGRHVPDKHHREILQDPKMMEEFEKRGKAFYRQKEKEAAEEKAHA